MIPPGGEGKITLEVNLKGYRGNVRKTATVFCNDPKSPRTILAMQGKVKTLIDVLPSNNISFRGTADQVGERTVEVASTTDVFHITGTETNLKGKIAYRLEPMEDGRKYRLLISNSARRGEYSGFIKLHTDLAQKNEITIRVNGYIQGPIGINPKSLLVGQFNAQETARSGRVTVVSNEKKPFQITKLVHNDKVIQVGQQPLADGFGYVLEIVPRVENIPTGKRQQTTLIIETDADAVERHEVVIYLLNVSGASR